MNNDLTPTDTKDDEDAAERLVLTPDEARVLAVLVEKEACTPANYPLSLNALVSGCNQRSNREPVMDLGERDVILALDRLRDERLAGVISQAGSRVPKYHHSFGKRYALSPAALAVVCELMLRGAQTVAELRTHAGRMTTMETADVEEALRELGAHATGPLVQQAPRMAGQRNERYIHTLCGDAGEAVAEAPPAAVEPVRQKLNAEQARIEKLEEQVAELQASLQALTEQFATFTRQFE